MKRLLVRCYPARWRDRYGEEFAAMLEDRPLGPFDVADVLLGALDAHLHLGGMGAASDHRNGFAMSLRIGGAAAIIGGLTWIAGLVGSGLSDDSSVAPIWALLLLVGTLALVVALVGLSAFQARAHPALIWAAFALPALGGTIAILGVIGMGVVGDTSFIAGQSPWFIWMLGTVGLVAGSALFALATWRTRALSRPAAALLLVGSLTIFPMFGISAGGGPLSAEVTIGIFVSLFGAGWIALGASAVRLDGRALRPGGGPVLS